MPAVEECFSDTKQNIKYYLKTGAVDAGLSAAVSGLLYPMSTAWAVQQNKLQGHYPSFRQACEHIHAKKAWYAGFPVSAATAIPGNFAYLSGRGVAAALFGDSTYGTLMQSPMGTAFGMACWAPGIRIELLQQVAATSQNQADRFSARACFKKIVKTNGVKDLYRGTGAYLKIFLLNDLIGSLLQITFLNQVEKQRRQDWSMQLMATLAGFSISSMLTIPLEAAVFPSMSQYDKQTQSLFSLARRNFHAHGIRAFTRGLPAGIANLALWHIIIPAKQQAKMYLDNSAPSTEP